MRAVRGQKEQVYIVVLPGGLLVVDELAAMNRAVIEDNDDWFGVILLDKMGQ